MTDTTPESLPLPKVHTGGGDPVGTLTVAELSELSGLIKGDVVAAITDKTQNRWEALALVGWALDRRERGKDAKREDWRQLTSAQLAEALGLNDTDPASDDLDPTAPGPS